MPKAYIVCCYRQISDPQKLAAYAKLSGPAFAPFGARYLALRVAAACPYRKSNPNVLMVQTSENWIGNDTAN
jgi:uncharacterized protein (DUF1330 family)